jgi:hypothetical protein
MKFVKIVFSPYNCVEEEETKPLLKTTSKSDVGIVITRRHVPARLLATRHTRLLRPDGLTRPEYQTARPTCQTRIRMTLSWRKHGASMHSWHTMSASSQLTRKHCGTHLPRHQPRAELSWAKLSWAKLSWAEPRVEGEDSVQRSLRATGSEIESGPFIRPELFWSNLSRLKCDLDNFRLVSS